METDVKFLTLRLYAEFILLRSSINETDRSLLHTFTNSLPRGAGYANSHLTCDSADLQLSRRTVAHQKVPETIRIPPAPDASAIALAGSPLLRRVSISAGVGVQRSGTEIKNRKIHT
jgi:hypothetical protein